MNSSSPTETQQALYNLPQSDYNVITSGTNGYSASAGYNLVTGLGTPVANLLVPDLVAYHGPGTTYSGPTVAPLQDATPDRHGEAGGGPINVFSVFDSFTVTSVGLGYASTPVVGTGLTAPPNQTPLLGTPFPAVAGPTAISSSLSGLSHGAPIALSIPMPITVTPPSGPMISSATSVRSSPTSEASMVPTVRSYQIRHLPDPTTSFAWKALDPDRASIRLADSGVPRLVQAKPAPITSFSFAMCWDRALMAYLEEGEAQASPWRRRCTRRRL